MIYKEKSVKALLVLALKEDIASGDITSNILIGSKETTKARIIAKEKGIVCGLDLIKEIFALTDKKVKARILLKDGDSVKPNCVIAELIGNRRSILKSERVILNFLSHLSAIATKTKLFIKETKGTKAKITDTRKTAPGMRLLDKYAVRCVGAVNHRSSLDKMVFIKDNHLQGRGIEQVLRIALKNKPENMKVEIEVESLKDFKKALELKPNIILLDNMKPPAMKKCVLLRNKQAGTVLLEASGNVNLDNVRRIAFTGVDFISVGSLTHTVKSLDISLELTNSRKT
ncbi:MAG: carboxylating nicotinate-nucleotide diphosphorylase [Candidatus Gygaella obscura]|nr:carboxylating nicotinate-nucleotide diphosphorylase [Candidatus Gygaella obscura]